jgi:hypothetical protein
MATRQIPTACLGGRAPPAIVTGVISISAKGLTTPPVRARSAAICTVSNSSWPMTSHGRPLRRIAGVMAMTVLRATERPTSARQTLLRTCQCSNRQTATSTVSWLIASTVRSTTRVRVRMPRLAPKRPCMSYVADVSGPAPAARSASAAGGDEVVMGGGWLRTAACARPSSRMTP